MRLPDKIYTLLKWLSIICLPAFSTFYLLISDIWGLPYGDQVAQTITGIAVLIGALIGISALSYNENKDREEQGE